MSRRMSHESRMRTCATTPMAAFASPSTFFFLNFAFAIQTALTRTLVLRPVSKQIAESVSALAEPSLTGVWKLPQDSPKASNPGLTQLGTKRILAYIQNLRYP